MRCVLCLAMVFWSALAAAQNQPEDEWKTLPGSQRKPQGEGTKPQGEGTKPQGEGTIPQGEGTIPQGERPELPAQSLSPPPIPVEPRGRSSPEVQPLGMSQLRARLQPRDEPNAVSMFGAPSLGPWRRAQALVLGFPVVQLRAAIGVTDSLDVGVGFDSFYLLMNEVRALLKYGFGKGPGFSVALALEGGAALFGQRASKETRGPRWITGRRNFNVVPGVILSYQGQSLRAPRFFLDLRYMVTFDTEPFATTPLQGVPSGVIVGHNVLSKFGAELPMSERTSFFFAVTLDLHLRPEDSPAMPGGAVGLVTGF